MADGESRGVSLRTRAYAEAHRVAREAQKLLLNVPTLSGPLWSFPEPLKLRMAALLKELDELTHDYEWEASRSALRASEVTYTVNALRRTGYPIEAMALEAGWDDPQADIVRCIHDALLARSEAAARMMKALQALLVNTDSTKHEELGDVLSDARNRLYALRTHPQ